MDKYPSFITDLLNSFSIPYELIEHKPAFTMEDMVDVGIKDTENVLKNLFVHDNKKQNFYLISVKGHKHVDLKTIKDKLGCKPLTFASEERLGEVLGLSRGAVTPLGIINDTLCRVTVVFDSDIQNLDHVWVHPNVNTASLAISPAHLEKIILSHGNKVVYVDLDSNQPASCTV